MRYLKITVISAFILSVILYTGILCRNLKNQDSTIPQITNEVDVLNVSVKYTEEDLLKGLKAVDEKDGDLTDQIMVAGISRFKSDGTCNVKYMVFDKNRNSDELIRKVCFVDYKTPRFSLTEPLIYRQGEKIDVLERVKAKDSLDGDLTEKIQLKSSSINNYQPGVYPVVLEVKNSYGVKSSIELEVIVQDAYTANEDLEIRLTQNILYVKQGKEFDPEAYVDSVWDEDSAIEDPNIEVSGNVDTDKPGCYHLSYSLIQENYYGEEIETEGLAYMTVVVLEGN